MPISTKPIMWQQPDPCWAEMWSKWLWLWSDCWWQTRWFEDLRNSWSGILMHRKQSWAYSQCRKQKTPSERQFCGWKGLVNERGQKRMTRLMTGPVWAVQAGCGVIVGCHVTSPSINQSISDWHIYIKISKHSSYFANAPFVPRLPNSNIFNSSHRCLWKHVSVCKSRLLTIKGPTY